MRVLIADDDRASRLLLERMLHRWGYEVVSATDGVEAWDGLSGADPPPLAVLDWMMPGIDGVELCRRAADLDRPCPPYIILLTAMDAKDRLVEGLEAGASDYITKPFSHTELAARIRVGKRVVQLQQALHGRATALQEALEHVKTLQGILPICMHCRRVRTDEASWQGLEAYVQNHAGAQLSHGVCPDCMETYYPVEPTDGSPDTAGDD